MSKANIAQDFWGGFQIHYNERYLKKGDFNQIIWIVFDLLVAIVCDGGPALYNHLRLV